MMDPRTHYQAPTQFEPLETIPEVDDADYDADDHPEILQDTWEEIVAAGLMDDEQ